MSLKTKEEDTTKNSMMEIAKAFATFLDDADKEYMKCPESAMTNTLSSNNNSSVFKDFR